MDVEQAVCRCCLQGAFGTNGAIAVQLIPDNQQTPMLAIPVTTDTGKHNVDVHLADLHAVCHVTHLTLL